MKTKKTISAIAIVAAITAVTAITASACSVNASDSVYETTPVCEISAYSLAEFMDNPYPNSFSNFRIIGNDTAYVLLNTSNNSVIGIYETPTDDDSSELALYEKIYNDMWSLR